MLLKSLILYVSLRHGDGIVLYIRSCFCSEVLSNHPFNLELIILSVSCGFSSCKFHIGLFYCPPSSLPTVYFCFAEFICTFTFGFCTSR